MPSPQVRQILANTPTASAPQDTSYAGYAIPTTSGMGQGAAQVFQPQNIPLDLSTFGQGLQQGVKGVTDGIKAKEAKDAQRAKVAQEAATTESNFSTIANAKQLALDEYMNKVEEDPKNADYHLRELKRQAALLEQMDKFKKAEYEDAANQKGRYVNTYSFTEEGVQNPAVVFDPLSASPEETQKRIKDAGGIDPFLAQLQRETSIGKSTFVADPKFSKENIEKAIIADIKTQLDLQQQEYLAKVAQDPTGTYDVATTVTTIPEAKYNELREQMLSRPDLMAGWMGNEIKDKGLPPQVFLGTPEGKAAMAAEYEAWVNGVLDTYKPRKTSLSTTKSGEGSGDGPGQPELGLTLAKESTPQLNGNTLYQAPTLKLGDKKVDKYTVSGITKNDEGKEQAIINETVTTSERDGNTTTSTPDIVQSMIDDPTVVEGYKNIVKQGAKKGNLPAVETAISDFEKAKVEKADITPQREGLKKHAEKVGYNPQEFVKVMGERGLVIDETLKSNILELDEDKFKSDVQGVVDAVLNQNVDRLVKEVKPQPPANQNNTFDPEAYFLQQTGGN